MACVYTTTIPYGFNKPYNTEFYYDGKSILNLRDSDKEVSYLSTLAACKIFYTSNIIAGFYKSWDLVSSG